MILLAFIAAGTAIVVFYWQYWTGGSLPIQQVTAKFKLGHKGLKQASAWGHTGIGRQLRDRLR